jgi:hypothetical protein
MMRRKSDPDPWNGTMVVWGDRINHHPPARK